jgi:hypothetical protein
VFSVNDNTVIDLIQDVGTLIKNYVKILKIDRGLLINFQRPGKNPQKTKLEIKEINFG